MMTRALQLIVAVVSPVFLCGFTGYKPDNLGTYGWVKLDRTDYPCVRRSKTQAELRACLPRVDAGTGYSREVQIRRERAKMLHLGYDTDAAINELQILIKKNPRSVDDLHLLARLHIDHQQKGRMLNEAVAFVNQALALQPESVLLQATVAYIVAESGDLQTAGSLFVGLLNREPNNVSFLKDLARIEVTRGEYEHAVAILDRLVHLEPNDPKWRAWRANGLYHLKHYKNAVDDYQAAGAAQILQSTDYYQLSMAQVRLGDLDGALVHLSYLIDGVPEVGRFASGDFTKASLLVTRSMIHYTHGRSAEAAADMFNALEIGGLNTVLRAQVLFANNGFDVDIDGKPSPELTSAITECFVDEQCTGSLAGIVNPAGKGCAPVEGDANSDGVLPTSARDYLRRC